MFVVELYHRLHARSASEDANAALSLLGVEMVVEAVVEFLHDGVEPGSAEDFAAACRVEFLHEELSHVGHVAHGALSIVRDVDGL